MLLTADLNNFLELEWNLKRISENTKLNAMSSLGEVLLKTLPFELLQHSKEKHPLQTVIFEKFQVEDVFLQIFAKFKENLPLGTTLRVWGLLQLFMFQMHICVSETFQISKMSVLRKQLTTSELFLQNAPSLYFDRVLDTPLYF